jgi:hypothetical protein
LHAEAATHDLFWERFLKKCRSLAYFFQSLLQCRLQEPPKHLQSTRRAPGKRPASTWQACDKPPSTLKALAERPASARQAPGKPVASKALSLASAPPDPHSQCGENHTLAGKRRNQVDAIIILEEHIPPKGGARGARGLWGSGGRGEGLGKLSGGSLGGARGGGWVYY